MSSFKLKTLSLVLSVLILGGFYSYGLWAWTGPTSAPPDSNAPTPINVGTADQEKAGRLSAIEFYDADNSSFYVNPSGDSMISGVLSLGGDLYDVTNSKKIYDSATGKFDPSVMPFEKGDLASDWATNTDISAYYDSTYDPSKVACGVSLLRDKPNGTYCSTCYSCSSGTCSPASVEGSAATSLACYEGDEGCRYCDNGVCKAYDDSKQHNCPAGEGCDNGACTSFPSGFCETHNGAYTSPTGDPIFCSGGKMWSTTLADGYEWGHYGEVVGDCTSSSDSTYPACYACNTLVYAGFTDWHLPSEQVLYALWGTDSNHLQCNNINCTSWDPNCCLDIGVYQGGYWNNREWGANDASMRYFQDGDSPLMGKLSKLTVRCVRP